MSDISSEERRLLYLRRMGIEQWVPRASVQPSMPEPVPVQAEEPEAAAVEAAVAAQQSAEGVHESRADSVAELSWEQLQARVADCRKCGLCETRRNTVFGVGNRNASLMVVGEAPGAEEDRRGEPFVGRAGKLLDNMLRAIGLDRTQVFIANILKCRPPDNRDPRPDEVAACEPYLKRQLELVEPRIILAVGRVAAQNLLKSDQPLGRLRGGLHHYGPGETPLLVSYHPAYLLRSPREKAKAWEDLKRVRESLQA